MLASDLELSSKNSMWPQLLQQRASASLHGGQEKNRLSSACKPLHCCNSVSACCSCLSATSVIHITTCGVTFAQRSQSLSCAPVSRARLQACGGRLRHGRQLRRWHTLAAQAGIQESLPHAKVSQAPWHCAVLSRAVCSSKKLILPSQPKNASATLALCFVHALTCHC